jgi:hypothetical protein
LVITACAGTLLAFGNELPDWKSVLLLGGLFASVENSSVELPNRSGLSASLMLPLAAFDELTDGPDEHAIWALEAIYTGPVYVYDCRVVASLERVLERRGVLPARV